MNKSVVSTNNTQRKCERGQTTSPKAVSHLCLRAVRKRVTTAIPVSTISLCIFIFFGSNPHHGFGSNPHHGSVAYLLCPSLDFTLHVFQ
jgi:hypothetical protein